MVLGELVQVVELVNVLEVPAVGARLPAQARDPPHTPPAAPDSHGGASAACPRWRPASESKLEKPESDRESSNSPPPRRTLPLTYEPSDSDRSVCASQPVGETKP